MATVIGQVEMRLVFKACLVEVSSLKQSWFLTQTVSRLVLIKHVCHKITLQLCSLKQTMYNPVYFMCNLSGLLTVPIHLMRSLNFLIVFKPGIYGD